MSKIAILTDSSSDIPQALEQKYGIDILCFPMTLDGVSYTERKDFTYDEFYNMMRTAQGVPTPPPLPPCAFWRNSANTWTPATPRCWRCSSTPPAAPPTTTR